MRRPWLRSVILSLVAVALAVAVGFAATTDDSFTAYEANSEEGTTYIEPGAIIFEGPSGPNHGYVELCHYPDEFLMVSGGLLVEDGMRGYRVMGWDGQTHSIMGAGYDYTFLSALPDYLGTPTDLWLYASGEMRLTAPEEDGQLRILLNGRPVLIPFMEAP